MLLRFVLPLHLHMYCLNIIALNLPFTQSWPLFNLGNIFLVYVCVVLLTVYLNITFV